MNATNNIQYLLSLKDILTKYEHDNSGLFFDLAYSEHFHKSNAPQNKVIEQLPEIFNFAQTKPSDLIEHDFRSSFWEFSHQHKANQIGTSTSSLSASLAIEIVSKFLRGNQFRTALIEPTFDNLPAILRRNGVELKSINENHLYPNINWDLLLSLDVEAIFIVMPNNPTGQWFNQNQFTELTHFCAKHRKLLIVDFCLRFFANLTNWDQYEIALNSGCDFVFIEDTGKTWPLAGLKTALLTTNQRIFEDIYQIRNELFFNVSPFVLEVIRQHIVNSKEHAFAAKKTILINRNYLRKKLENTALKVVYEKSDITFEWLEIINNYDDQRMWRILSENGIHTLPGSLFFWNTPTMGSKNLRIAVMREPLLFKSAIDKLAETLFLLKDL